MSNRKAKLEKAREDITACKEGTNGQFKSRGKQSLVFVLSFGMPDKVKDGIKFTKMWNKKLELQVKTIIIKIKFIVRKLHVNMIKCAKTIKNDQKPPEKKNISYE